MASYDLRCRSCGKEFEVFVLGFLKDEAKVCPDCGGREVEQRFTGFGGVHRTWRGLAVVLRQLRAPELPDDLRLQLSALSSRARAVPSSPVR